jgi:Ca2+/Na+ antiporter
MIFGAALGANLWLVATVAPLVAGGAWANVPARHVFPLFLLVVGGPAALWLGFRRRSAFLLLALFPFVAFLPLVVREVVRIALPLPPWPLLAASLATYLLAASWALERPEALALEGVEARALAPERTPERWLRRQRVYRMLSAAALVLPLGLIWALDLRRSAVDAFDRAFAGHGDAVRAIFTGGIALIALFLFRFYLLAPLESHLQQDRETRAAIEALRKQAKRGRPRLGFYLYVVLALVAMAAVVWERTR